MNKLNYRVIFSKYLGQLVAVGENACAHGKSASGERSSRGSMAVPNRPAKSAAPWSAGLMRDVSLGLMALCGMSAMAHASTPDNALPTGSDVQRGGVTHSVNDAGNTMTIHQTTSRAVVNYDGFNVGKSATVNHTGGLLLGRVVGAEASRIDGALNTSGMVLVNPNGIAIGGTGNINAGNFTASTFNVSDDNFMAGKLHFERNGSNAGVVNHGKITTGGGYVALVGASVNNHGSIQTQGGDVALVASDDAVTLAPETKGLKVQLSSKVSLELNASALNAHVANHQDGVIVTEGGQVLMRAAAMLDAVSGVTQAQVHQAGRIDTSAEQGGRVDVLADHGLVRVSGNINTNTNSTAPVLLASAAPAGGDIFIGRDDQTHVLAHVGDVRGAQLESKGGFIETSGLHLVTDGVNVTAKDWLLDPTDVEIVGAKDQLVEGSIGNSGGIGGVSTFTPNSSGKTSQISASTINAAINKGTNVTIQTASTGTQDGTITVNAAVLKDEVSDPKGLSTPTLKLDAAGRIIVNKNITATAGSLSLDLQAKNGGVVVKDGVSISLNQGTLTADVKAVGTEVGFAIVTKDGVSASIAAKQVNIHTNTLKGSGLVLANNSTITVSEGLRIITESTDGAGGNIEVLGKIANAGKGDIVLAAGSDRKAGDGKGGQVITAPSQRIETGEGGKIYIYTGNANDTGKLSDLVGSLGELRLSDIGDAKQNTDTFREFEVPVKPLNAESAQVFFREKVDLNLVLKDEVVYGNDTDDVFGQKAVIAGAPKDPMVHSHRLDNDKGELKIALQAVIDSLDAGKVKSAVDALKNVEGNRSSSGNLKAGVYGNKLEAPLNLVSNKYGGIRGELEVLRKNLTISGVKVSNKVYDGNTTAIVDTSAALNFAGVVTGANDVVDDVKIVVAKLTATFGDKDVGTEKTVTLGGFEIEGVDQLNYNIKNQKDTTADITPRPLEITAQSAERVYNGLTQEVALVLKEVKGWLDGDGDINELVTASASGKTVGEYEAAFSILEGALKNYKIDKQTPGTLTIVAVSPPVPPEPVPPVPPEPEPEREPENPATPGGPNSGRTSVRLADANPFALASLDDEPVCSIDNLSACYCEKARDEEEQPLERLNVCMPEKPENTDSANKALKV